MGRLNNTVNAKAYGKNTDLNVELSEIIFDREQYYQELVCAFSVIKKNGLESEYLGAVNSLVHDLNIKRSIVNCITDRKRVLGREINDYNKATRNFIKKHFIALRCEFEDERTAELHREIAELKNKLDEISNIKLKTFNNVESAND